MRSVVMLEIAALMFGMMSTSYAEDAKRASATQPRSHAATQSPKVYTGWPFDSNEALRRQEESARALGVDKTVTLDLGNKVTMKLVLIPAGKFMMGSPDSEKNRSSDERPQHWVTISKPYYMATCEVTQEQNERVTGKKPKRAHAGRDYPMQSVSWHAAAGFCGQLAKKTGRQVRLPTEAEWEFACRAGSEACFSFGKDYDKLGDYAWHEDNSGKKCHPVGQKKPNAWGLYDTHGNVMEWCADWYRRYSTKAVTDPKGPSFGKDRVIRGGSIQGRLFTQRSAARTKCWAKDPRDIRYFDFGGFVIGFRVAVDLPKAEQGTGAERPATRRPAPKPAPATSVTHSSTGIVCQLTDGGKSVQAATKDGKKLWWRRLPQAGQSLSLEGNVLVVQPGNLRFDTATGRLLSKG